MKELTQAEKKRWMRQWKSAALALQQVKRRELAAMTDDDVRKAISWLLADTTTQYKNPRYQTYSGLIDQQRYFKKMYRKLAKEKKT